MMQKIKVKHLFHSSYGKSGKWKISADKVRCRGMARKWNRFEGSREKEEEGKTPQTPTEQQIPRPSTDKNELWLWSTSVARAWRLVVQFIVLAACCLPPKSHERRDGAKKKQRKKKTVVGRLVLTYTEEKFKNIIYLSTTMWRLSQHHWYLVCNSNDCGHRKRREYLIRAKMPPSTFMHP